MRAKTLFLTHTEATRRYIPPGMGEIANSLKLKKLMDSQGYECELLDIFELFGGPKELYRELALLNYDLAREGKPMIDDVGMGEVKKICAMIERRNPSSLFILSHHWSLAALHGMGLQKKYPLAAKFYLHHSDEKVFPELYKGAHLLITESPLANQMGDREGIPRWKMIYLPHSYPKALDDLPKDRKIILEIAERVGKKINLSKESLIIGTASRLVMGKNVEYALSSAKELILKGYPLIFVLKGDIARSNPYEIWLEEQLMKHIDESWFIWDRNYASLSEMMRFYRSLDIAIQLSGAEAGSNTIVELLASGVPTLILDASTNPTLFAKSALFVRKDPEVIAAPLAFYRPNNDDCVEKLESLVKDKKLREELSHMAQNSAKQKFSEKETLSRLPLLMDALFSNFRGETSHRALMEKLFEKDCEL